MMLVLVVLWFEVKHVEDTTLLGLSILLQWLLALQLNYMIVAMMMTMLMMMIMPMMNMYRRLGLTLKWCDLLRR